MAVEVQTPGSVTVDLGDFKLIPGPQGERGPRGYSVESVVMNPDYTLTFNLENGNSYTTPVIRGVGATIRVSEDTITGGPGESASVENIGTETAAVLRFKLPQGPQGPAGRDGEVTREELDEAIAEHAARSWTLEVTADKWVAGTDTWEEFTGNYKAELIAEGMTAETVIDTVNFVSGSLEAASTWVYYKPGAGTVTLWSRDKPAEDFTIRLTEVVV